MIEKYNIAQVVDLNIINGFDCGEQIVNDFIRNNAVIYENQNLMSTTIFYDTAKNMVVGYYSTASSIIEVKSYYDVRKFHNKITLPEDEPLGSAFPAIEIGWFGVDLSMQRKTIGTAMMNSLVQDMMHIRYAHNVAFSAVVVGALPGAVEFYERFSFQYLHNDFDKTGQIEETYPMFLDLNLLTKIYEASTGETPY